MVYIMFISIGEFLFICLELGVSSHLSIHIYVLHPQHLMLSINTSSKHIRNHISPQNGLFYNTLHILWINSSIPNSASSQRMRLIAHLQVWRQINDNVASKLVASDMTDQTNSSCSLAFTGFSLYSLFVAEINLHGSMQDVKTLHFQLVLKLSLQNRRHDTASRVTSCMSTYQDQNIANILNAW